MVYRFRQWSLWLLLSHFVAARWAGPLEAWQANITGSLRGLAGKAKAVAVASDGVVAAGGLYDSSVPSFYVAKMNPETGAVLWRYARESVGIQVGAEGVGIDSHGDVIVAGYLAPTDDRIELVLVKLDGADGTVLWSSVLDRMNATFAEFGTLLLDPGDNPVLALVDVDSTVVKVDGRSGDPVWHVSVPPLVPQALAVDRVGDIVLSQGRETFTVLKLAGADGSEIWRSTRLGGGVGRLAVDASNDVVAAGHTSATKLSGETGREMWTHSFDSIGLTALALSREGDAILALGYDTLRLSGADGRELWRRSPQPFGNGTRTDRLAVDAAGNVFGAGLATLRGGAFGVYSLGGSDGVERWALVADEVDGDGRALALALTATGDPVAAGFTPTREHVGSDFAVVRLKNDTGADCWRTIISGAGVDISGDGARAVAVDQHGNIAAVGSTENVGTGHDFSVVKLNGADGRTLWRRDIAGTQFRGNDLALAVAMSPQDDVVAAGIVENFGTGDDFVAVKLASGDGAEIWRAVIDSGSGGRDFARAIAINTRGDVVVGGDLSRSGDGKDFAVVKLAASTGMELWRSLISGTGHEGDTVLKVAVDSDGAVIAVGIVSNLETRHDFVVAKLGGDDGRELWRTTIQGNRVGSMDEGYSVAVDAADDVIAAGLVNGGNETTNTNVGADFAVVKLTGSDGTEVWRRVIAGTDAVSGDIARTVAVDDAGNVTAAGSLEQAEDIDSQLTTVRFDAATGTERWRNSIGSGISEALALALDAEGNPVVAGRTSRSGFTVQKLDRRSGDEVWRRELNGSAARDQSEIVYAVAVDGAGDVIAAGNTFNDESFFDFTVVKLSGADGSSINQCFGDCSGDLSVGVSELVLGVRILLDEVAATACPAVDANGDTRVTVDELIRAVRFLLAGCPV